MFEISSRSGVPQLNPTRRHFLQSIGAVGTAAFVARQPSRAQSRIPYVDGLSFLPSDMSAVRESGLTAFILDTSAGEMVAGADGRPRFVRSFNASAKAITATRRRLRENPHAFLATRGSEIADAQRRGQTAVFLQFQGCEPLEGDLERIDIFYELGLRVLQLTHHHDNPFGGGAMEASPSGLTPLGIQAVERMNTMGIIPDVSHASDRCALDVTRYSRSPVVLSHGGARALVPNARCAPDEVIRAIANTGGVMGIFMMSFWLTTDPHPTVDHLIRQIRHVVNVGGTDAVGIANDYPITGEAHLAQLGNDNEEGVKAYHPWWQSMAERGILGFEALPEHVVIPELNNIRRMERIHRALESARFESGAVEKIMGGNWIRVLRQTLG